MKERKVGGRRKEEREGGEIHPNREFGPVGMETMEPNSGGRDVAACRRQPKKTQGDCLMRTKHFMAWALVGLLTLPGLALAHTPLFSCFDNADGTIYCEGGFSDGSSAAGVAILVKDGNGEVLLRDELAKTSDIEFDKPEGEYTVIFDAGEGHDIKISGSQIFE